MAPTEVEIFNGMAGINVRQLKTGRKVWVPITRSLAAAMEGWEHQSGPFLRRLNGSSWTPNALTNAWLYERDHNTALAPIKAAGLVLHGLRGHTCVRLLRAGANTRQIADMLGMSEQMVARYTRLSSQRENAAAAVYHLERMIKERSTAKSNSMEHQ